ncbi:hypothetical protein L484_026989 [Morus notabilis]|uniref:Uncharacterized protein n=1 Tax=Morus notabilis TaxID=981085 RepID=W9RPL6_9ROSA|nr:hypothetical protein L484_026989 [Morus notabilis]
MSGLVDMWTSEKAKMEKNDQTLFSKGSGPSGDVSVEEVKGKELGSTGFRSSVLGKIRGTISPLAISCSEASVFMVVLCTP